MIRSNSAEAQNTTGVEHRNLNGLWSCHFCFADFQRYDHLKRHIATHTSERPYQCEFCGSPYKRGDALRRHWKSCSARIESGQCIPEPRHGGKEKHACDGCAKAKKSCNGELPCSECCTRDRICTYQRLHQREEVTLQSGSSESSQEQSPPSDNRSLNHSTWDLGLQTFYPGRDAWFEAYGRLVSSGRVPSMPDPGRLR
ncbi:hypothetical protein F9C07_1397004 [Aspergillus flavus]|uniref:C2H2-type domain-containing protein n=2 Tax=Aspergillus flavus TaxID=5059 RepID=A0A7U2QV05_ASPFN|nr:hypothetical protein BDV35DRAFT_115210 [Aspergillus flavus]KOC08545.1 hypothetical protein AFLA70_98g003380 [Aspergillus flavus AF70]QRD85858.1 hypothetical protein F9C07_1397004 [Aspergillus flavus]